MPNAGVDTSLLGDVMKTIYGTIAYQQNTADPAIAMAEDLSEGSGWDGQGAFYQELIVLARTQDYISIPENGILPNGGNTKTANLKIPVKDSYGAISLTHRAMLQVESKTAGYISPLLLETEGLIETVRSEGARQMYGTGLGALCQVNGALAIGATVVVVDNRGLQLLQPVGGAQFVKIGMRLAVFDPTGVTLLGNIKVVGVSDTGLSFTVDPITFAIANDCIIFKASTDTQNSATLGTNKNNEPMGFGGMVANASLFPMYFGFNRNLFPHLSSKIFPAVGALTDGLFQQIYRAAQMQSANGVINPGEYLAIAEPSVLDAVIALQQPKRTYQTDQALMNPDLGTRGITEQNHLTIGGIAQIPSINAPYGEYLLVAKDGFKKATLDQGWVNKTGAIWNQLTSAQGRQAAWVADWFKIHNYWHTQPRKCVKATGISVAQVFHSRF